MTNTQQIKRGDIFYADLSPVVGSEQGGLRPVLVVQNNIGNKYSPTIIVAAITSQLTKAKLPTHLSLPADTFNLPKDSVILFEQLRTIDKRRLKNHVGTLDDRFMRKANEALVISLGLLGYTSTSLRDDKLRLRDSHCVTRECFAREFSHLEKEH